MDSELSESQTRILLALEDKGVLTYEELAEATGLSYDGVRGRVSELCAKGFKIYKEKVEGKTCLELQDEIKVAREPLKKPVTYGDLVSSRNKGLGDFYGITELLNKLHDADGKKIKVKKSKSDTTTALLVLSDLHFGQVIKQHGVIRYDSDIARLKIEELTAKVLRELDDEPIETINIAMLGDMVDGDAIYKNHTFQIDRPAIAQVQDVVKSLTNMIKTFITWGYNVDISCIRGNHGITNYKNLDQDNWDNIVYDMLDLVFEDNDSVTIEHYQDSEIKMEVLDKQVVLVHGDAMLDQIKTASGNKVFRGIVGKHKLNDGDMVLCGHLHTFGVETDQDKILIRNGALPPASEFALSLNLYSEPMQTLMVITEGRKYPKIIPIELEDV